MATQQCVRLVMALLKTARGLGLLDGRGLEAAGGAELMRLLTEMLEVEAGH